jgi:hypothetical protein
VPSLFPQQELRPVVDELDQTNRLSARLGTSQSWGARVAVPGDLATPWVAIAPDDSYQWPQLAWLVPAIEDAATELLDSGTATLHTCGAAGASTPTTASTSSTGAPQVRLTEDLSGGLFLRRRRLCLRLGVSPVGTALSQRVACTGTGRGRSVSRSGTGTLGSSESCRAGDV